MAPLYNIPMVQAGLGETLINKLYCRQKFIEAYVLFVFSTFFTNGLLGNLDSLLPDHEPAVRDQRDPICVPSQAAGLHATSRFKRHIMHMVDLEH